MINTPEILTSVQQLVSDLSKIDRNHYRPGSDRRENVAEHSLSVATLAWYLHDFVHSKTNLELVLKYAVAHDFVEVYAGDVNTFADAAARTQKEIDEQKALDSLTANYQDFPDLLRTLNSYQCLADPEALFVWTTDKIQALILGRMDNWRAYHETKISTETFNAKHIELQKRAASELKPLYRAIIDWSNETYDETA